MIARSPYARLNLWTFTLPGLAERREDIAPNLDYELDRFAERESSRVTFNKEAREHYVTFATSAKALWPGNFRYLAASITRMATFSPAGRIDLDCVKAEISRMERAWALDHPGEDGLDGLMSEQQLAAIDPFDRVQLAFVVKVCRESRTLSDAGRTLFSASLSRRASSNDADRLRKYLGRFELAWPQINAT